jgi:hypothetical protein
MVDPADLLRWGLWRRLATASRDPEIPHLPGLYRIRRVGRDDLDYFGQTGQGTMTLRKRLSLLRGVYGEIMPYRDPHTAGPALWALNHQTGDDFEVSVVPVAGSTPWRKGLEALAIALYRQRHSRSPTIEFGRMPVSIAPRRPTTGACLRQGESSVEDYARRPTLTMSRGWRRWDRSEVIPRVLTGAVWTGVVERAA